MNRESTRQFAARLGRACSGVPRILTQANICVSAASIRRLFLSSGSVMALTLLWTGDSHAQQFVVTNGTTQTAPGPTYSAVAANAAGSALFANNANSTINGTNLTLTSAFTSAS